MAERARKMKSETVDGRSDDLPFSKAKATRRYFMEVDEFKATTDTEEALQRQCEQYLRARKIDFVRIPDWIYRLVTSNPKLRKWISQYFKGLPDLMIFRQWKSPYNLALFVELKKKGGQLSQGQEALGRRLNVLVIREFELFVVVVDRFLEQQLQTEKIQKPYA
jgi:hypothetical protein